MQTAIMNMSGMMKLEGVEGMVVEDVIKKVREEWKVPEEVIKNPFIVIHNITTNTYRTVKDGEKIPPLDKDQILRVIFPLYKEDLDGRQYLTE
jgi:hypothetical protein